MSGSKQTRPDSRQEFLKRSAILLQETAPSTSAFLSAERFGSLISEEVPITVLQQAAACLACGSLQRIPVQSMAVAARKSKSSPGYEREHNHEGYVCGRCHRKTKTKNEQQKAGTVLTREEQRQVALQESGPEAAGTSSIPNSPTTSRSRKRARSRKNATLQTLLKRSKETEQHNKSPAFDFMDFMKAT